MTKRDSFLPCFLLYIWSETTINGTWIEIYFKTQSYCSPCFPRIVLEKILRALFFPLESCVFIAISDSMHQRNYIFFFSFLFVMNFPRFLANKQTPPGGYHGLMWQKKKINQNGYKIVTMKEGLETTHNDHTLVSYCEFQSSNITCIVVLDNTYRDCTFVF